LPYALCSDSILTLAICPQSCAVALPRLFSP
jgi:hypothetical protein